MKLLIVESPGKIKKIRSILKDDWNIAASIGHIRDLPLKTLGVYPPEFKPMYIPTERGERVIEELKQRASAASEVYLATDPDREGEAIAWHVAESLELKDPKRVTYSEITETAINKALAAPRSIDMNLVRAQEGRRVLDRLFGYTVSSALKTASGRVFSAGRVQSPALRLVVERERAIRDFKPLTHYGVELYFGPKGEPNTYKAVLNPKNLLLLGQSHFQDKKLAEKICAIKELIVSSFSETNTKENPPAPFITSTLQQASSITLKLDPKDTMELAQRLYEEGNITYMRTDSPKLSEEAIAEIRQMAAEKGYPLPPEPRVFSAKEGSQEAHEAIRPTSFKVEEAGQTEKEKALYRLIWVRSMASQLSQAVYAVRNAKLTAAVEGKTIEFIAAGRKLISSGFKVLTPNNQAEEENKETDELNNPVPLLKEGDKLSPHSSQLKTKKTNPPPRYTQASLIKELEKRGIGRPSTYAAIMENITSRGYIQSSQRRQLMATETGETLISYLIGNFGFLEYNFTRSLEEDLDGIAKGKALYLEVVASANKSLASELLAFVRNNRGRDKYSCPACGGPLINLQKDPLKAGGYNFWKCQNPNCGANFDDKAGAPDLNSLRQSTLSSYTCRVCASPLRHLVKKNSNDPKNDYNYWRCSKEGCMTYYNDADNKPDYANGPDADSPSFSCPDCNARLRHLQREAANGASGYNYWKCPRENCGAFYDDAGGEPDFRTKRRVLTSGYTCPNCESYLKHTIREGDPKTKAGSYNYWYCSDRSCLTYFNDKDGEPDFSTQRRTLKSDARCPKCNAPLRHAVKGPDAQGQGAYNYWYCSNKDCHSSFKDKDGSPDFGLSAQEPEVKCPSCGEPLRHLVRQGEGQGASYNYWKCPNPSCGSLYDDKDGSPLVSSHRQSIETQEPCPKCDEPLRHIFRAPDAQGQGGYDYWSCSNRECRASFEDKDGSPDFDSPRIPGKTNVLCPACNEPLRHLVREGQSKADSYNYWRCSSDLCGSIYNDMDGAPDPKSRRRSIPSDYVCPKCNELLRHSIKDPDGLGQGGYDYWTCPNRQCRASFPDQNGAPDLTNLKSSELSDIKCPACNEPLRHLMREGSPEESYNYWKCTNSLCASSYDDQDGQPNLSSRRQSIESQETCPKCASFLRHNIKAPDQDGKGGYDYWACSNRECRATFNDDNGAPDFDKPRIGGLTDIKCPFCSSPLRHLKREGNEAQSYNYWRCSDSQCGSIFDDQGDSPNFETHRQSILTLISCPQCNEPLRHSLKAPSLTGEGGYNYWSCSNLKCKASYNDKDGSPDLSSPRILGLTEVKCPVCSSPLRHLERKDTYNYWRCTNSDCNTIFNDKDNAPDPQTRRQSIITQIPCPKCNEPLRHNLKDGDGSENGYNYWSCSNSQCRSYFNDKAGEPDFLSPYQRRPLLTDVSCPSCGKPLSHLVKVGDNPKDSYNYWKCTNELCGSRFENKDDKPDPTTARQSILSPILCPKCSNFLRHNIKPDSPDSKGYNFWVCSDRNCNSFFNDIDGAPDFTGNNSSSTELSNYTCPDCGDGLIHIKREGGQKSYNFWKCSNDTCGSYFEDIKDTPDFESIRKSVITSEKCPACSSPLKHNFRDQSAKLSGYDYWLCTNAECGKSFQDDMGGPGPERIKSQSTVSDYKCPDCGKPLRHIVKPDDPTSRGYNFWGCTGYPDCQTTLADDNGKPGAKNAPRNVPSGFKCPRCQSDLFHRKGISNKTGSEYDFFACSNPSCRAIYNTKNDEPDIPEVIRKQLKEQGIDLGRAINK